MKKLFNKKAVCGFITILLSISLAVSISASAGNKPVSDIGRGYINIPSMTSISAWTEASSKGTSAADYVFVNFWGYTGGSTVWRPLSPTPDSEGGVKKIGTSIVEANASNTKATNLKSGDSYHEIARNGYPYSTWNTGIQAG